MQTKTMYTVPACLFFVLVNLSGTAGENWTGALKNTWSEGQCANIARGPVVEDKMRNGTYAGLSDIRTCQLKCEDTPLCTAVNYAILGGSCKFRQCASPVPPPDTYTRDYAGYHVAAKPYCGKILDGKCSGGKVAAVVSQGKGNGGKRLSLKQCRDECATLQLNARCGLFVWGKKADDKSNGDYEGFCDLFYEGSTCSAGSTLENESFEVHSPVECKGVASCSDGIKNQNETEVDCGGPKCWNCTCSDGEKNQGETGVDCGGTKCGACNGGLSPWSNWGMCSKTCGGGQKTKSRTCTNPAPSNGGKLCSGSLTENAACNAQTCEVVAATCSDGIKNQAETGLDCGGTCGACIVAATCSDGIKNQAETGLDCGGTCGACSAATNAVVNVCLILMAAVGVVVQTCMP